MDVTAYERVPEGPPRALSGVPAGAPQALYQRLMALSERGAIREATEEEVAPEIGDRLRALGYVE